MFHRDPDPFDQALPPTDPLVIDSEQLFALASVLDSNTYSHVRPAIILPSTTTLGAPTRTGSTSVKRHPRFYRTREKSRTARNSSTIHPPSGAMELSVRPPIDMTDDEGRPTMRVILPVTPRPPP